MSEHVLPVRVYLLIFATLLVLTGVTVGVAYLDLGPLNTVVAMTIAMIKGLLVVLWFMHLKFSGRLTMIYAGAGVLWLVILLALTLSDYLTRETIVFPGS